MDEMFFEYSLVLSERSVVLTGMIVNASFKRVFGTINQAVS